MLIWLGINDSKDGWWDEADFLASYRKMISDLKVNGKTKVLVAVPTPLYKDGIYKMR